MAVASWRPDIAVQVAFNADPNDSTAVPNWTDLSPLFRGAVSIKRGRQYELDENQASDPQLLFMDRDEYLNPANTASPYAPNVVPYRQILWQAQYPNGATGNLLNAGYGTNPNLLTVDGYDPSFESYAVGSLPPWVLHFGGPVHPVVSTVNPFQGTKSLQYSVQLGQGEQGVGLRIPCIPGRQYTSSMYVRQTGANTSIIFINGTATGSSTTTTGSYVRLTVTWTAVQPVHELWVVSFSPTLNSTVNVDAIQHEQSPTASAFTTAGPTIYGVLRQYVERWPSRWDYAGFLGLAQLTLVDAFGPQNQIILSTEYDNALLATKPDFYWRLDEPENSATFAETSGNSGPPLQRFDSIYGPAPTFAAGTSTNIPGDPSGNGVEISGADLNINEPSSIIQSGYADSPPFMGYISGSTLPMSWSSAFWLTRTTTFFGTRILMASSPLNGLNFQPMLWSASASPDIVYSAAVDPSHNVQCISTGDPWADGKPHLYVGVTTIASGAATVTMYVDGVQAATNTVLTTGWPAPPWPVTSVQVGAAFNLLGFYTPNLPDAVYSKVGLWNRALSLTEIGDLWNAGKGYEGEMSGTRVARYLKVGNWFGPSQIDTGQSVMGVSNLTAGTALLAANQGVTTTENGNYWVDSLGNTTFAARTRRYLATTSTYTFGEDVAGGELPYQGDIIFDYDPTLVYNAVEIDNYQGITAVASDLASQKRYYPRGYPRQINVEDQFEAIDAAVYLLGQHKDPHLRVETIVLNPAAYPQLWPVILGMEIGLRVTVKRRAKAANGGKGLTIFADFYIESIQHDTYMGDDQTPPSWLTTLYLSPVDIYQVGILDNSVFGRLGTGGASLHSAISATATSISVDLTGGDLFTTAAGTWQATIDQEIVTVTAVTGATTPQALTIARPTDGTAVAHAAGAPVQVYQALALAY